MDGKEEKSTETVREEIFRLGEVTTGEPGSEIKCISVIGQIEGHYLLGDNQKATKYEHLIPLLVEAEENPEVKGVLFVLNTMGGDVEAGLALSELIASMKKPTVSSGCRWRCQQSAPLSCPAPR